MKWLSDFLDWFNKQLGRIKTIAVIVLVILFAVAAINNGCQREYANDLVERVTGLNVQNDILKKENKEIIQDLDSLKTAYRELVLKYERTDSIRDVYGEIIADLKYQRDTLKDYIRKTPTNELYEWLDKIRFPYQGEKIYKFNQPQVSDIYYVTQDYDIVKEENEVLSDDISQCDYQLALKDSLLNNRMQSMALMKSTVRNNNEIILNLEEKVEVTEDQVKRYKRKLFWWKLGTGVAVVGGIILAL